MKWNSVLLYVAITVLSHFILCLLEGENKRDMESIGDKKIHGIPFYPSHSITFLKVLTLKAEILIIISNKLICLKRFFNLKKKIHIVFQILKRFK